MKVHWGEIDGVPTLSAEAGAIAGPLQACLMFGTGRSDETLKVSGINHVIEHLVLYGLGEETAPYSYNGDVSPIATRFLAVGPAHHVVEFLNFVVRGIRELPLDRLADECKVLDIESRPAGRRSSAST